MLKVSRMQSNVFQGLIGWHNLPSPHPEASVGFLQNVFVSRHMENQEFRNHSLFWKWVSASQ